MSRGNSGGDDIHLSGQGKQQWVALTIKGETVLVNRTIVRGLLDAEQLKRHTSRQEVLQQLRAEMGIAPTDVHPMTKQWANEWVHEEVMGLN